MFNPIGSTNTPTEPNPLQSDINTTATTQINPASIHQPMSPSQMEREMDEMINKVQMGFDFSLCRDAKSRIIKAYKTNADHLDLSGFKLRQLPACIGQLQHLNSLKIDNNQLVALPKEIGKLNNLTTLDAYWNKLTTLPPETWELSNLTELRLSNNQLTTLPPEIGQLNNLTELYLNDNQLTTLPLEILNLSNLARLNLDKNQLTTLPIELQEFWESKKWEGNPSYTLQERYGPVTYIDPTFDRIEEQLTEWVQHASAGEDRLGVQQRIMEAYKQPPEVLKLNKVWRTNLPECLGQYPLNTLQIQLASLGGVVDEGLFTYVPELKQVRLYEGRITGGGQAPQEGVWHYNPTTKDMAFYVPTPNTPHPTPDTAPLTPALIAVLMNTTPEQLQQWLNVNPHTFTQQMERLLEINLDSIVTMPQLPQHLANLPECKQFFDAFAQQINGQYFALQALVCGALLKTPAKWAQGIAIALQVLSLPGTGVAAGVVSTLSQKREQKIATQKAFAVLSLFDDLLQFNTAARHAGVLFTQRLAHELQAPEVSSSGGTLHHPRGLMKKLEHAYTQLEIKMGLQAENPWENSPMVRQAAAVFLHQLLENHTVRDTATTKHLPLYPQRLAEQAVNAVLGTPEASTSNSQPSSSGDSGTPPSHIAMMVPTPVAGPALDELEQQNQERDTQIAELQQQKQKLEKHLVEIKQTVDTLAQEHASIKAKLNHNDLLDKNTSTQANTQTHQHMLVVGVDRPSRPTRPQNTTPQQPNAQLLEVVRDLHGRVQLFEMEQIENAAFQQQTHITLSHTTQQAARARQTAVHVHHELGIATQNIAQAYTGLQAELEQTQAELQDLQQHVKANRPTNRAPAAHQVALAMQAELSLEQITRVAAHYLHGFAMNSVRLTPNNTWNVQLKGHNPMRKMHLLGLKWVSLEHQLITLHGDRGNTPYQPMNELTELTQQLPSTHTLRAKLINNPSNQQRLAEAMDEVLNG